MIFEFLQLPIFNSMALEIETEFKCYCPNKQKPSQKSVAYANYDIAYYNRKGAGVISLESIFILYFFYCLCTAYFIVPPVHREN